MLPKTDAAKHAAANKNTTLLPNGKIRFDQTGMEFPATVTSAVLNAYVNGKAFRRAVARRASEAYDFSVHEPYIVLHRERDERHFLYCTLTKATLPRDSHIVQNHVSAKRFRRRLAEVEEARRKQMELAERRREKRERAKASRVSKAEEDEEAGDRMDEDDDISDKDNDVLDEGSDVLDGIISDDDDSIISGENVRESPKSEGPVENRKERLGEVEQNGCAMDEDEMEKEETEEGSDLQRGESHEKQKSKRKSKKKVETERAQKTKEAVVHVHYSPDKIPVATGKRNLVKAQVPKKVQRARQRRKAMKAT